RRSLRRAKCFQQRAWPPVSSKRRQRGCLESPAASFHQLAAPPDPVGALFVASVEHSFGTHRRPPPTTPMLLYADCFSWSHLDWRCRIAYPTPGVGDYFSISVRNRRGKATPWPTGIRKDGGAD